MSGKHAELAQIAYDHAEHHYNDKGIRWDYVVETMDISDMAEELAEHNITTKAAAISYFKKFAKLMDEMESNSREY